MGPPKLELVMSTPLPQAPKAFSFDIVQIHEGSDMMSIDACLPIPVVLQLLELLKPYA